MTELSSMRNFRRFFISDTVSTFDDATGLPSVIRFAKEVNLRVQLRGQRLIFPPVLQITYSDVSATSTEKINTKFHVSYTNPTEVEENISNGWNIATGVIIPLFFFISLIPVFSYTRRDGAQTLNLGQVVLKFILCILDGVAWALMAIAFGFSFYWFLENNGEVPTDPISDSHLGHFK